MIINLALDTSVWISLLTHPDISNTLRTLVSKGSIRVLVPETVMDEWQHLRADKIKSLISSLRGQLRNAMDAEGPTPGFRQKALSNDA